MNFKRALITVLPFIITAATNDFPIELAARDVFNPTIIAPNGDTVWTIGSIQSVTWDTSNAPERISCCSAVVLRQAGLFLAEGFDLRTGIVNVTVPEVTPGTYQITLFGDSDNFSPLFHIVAA